MSHELQLLLLLAIIIFVSKIAGHLSQRFLNQPVVFGEILAGLLLGPTVLNIFGWPIFTQPNEWLSSEVQSLAHIGVLLLMFIAGLETDIAQMRRVGRVALITALFGVGLPLVTGMLASHFFGFSFSEAIFIGVILTATSVSISAQTLMEISQLRSKEGATIMGAAIIDDVLGIILLSLVIAFLGQSVTAHSTLSMAGIATTALASVLGVVHAAAFLKVAFVLFFLTLFFVLAVWIGKRVLPAVMATADRLHASHAVPAAALFLIFLFAVGAEFIGQVAAITGAYLVGVFLARTPYRQRIEKAVHPFTYAFFVPIFFMSIGLAADARSLPGGAWVFVGVICAVAILSKIIGCAAGARVCGFHNKESMRVGIGMISRGEVGLIIAQIGITVGIIAKPVYTTMVIMVLATTVVTPILLRLAFPRQPEVQTEIYESVVGVEVDDDDPATTRDLS